MTWALLSAAAMGLSQVDEIQQRLFWPVLAAMLRGVRIRPEIKAQMALDIQEELSHREAFLYNVLGHGINTQQFSPLPAATASKTLRLLPVGRISPTKDYESMIKALDILGDSGIKNITLTIVGAPALPDQRAYLDSLQQMVQKMGLTERVRFVGSIPHTRVPEYLRQHDAFINLSGTGSLDKAVLEAMATGCIPLTSNDAFSELLPSDLLVKSNDPHGLAAKIRWLSLLPIEKRKEVRQQLRAEIIQYHNLDTLIGKVVTQFKL